MTKEEIEELGAHIALFDSDGDVQANGWLQEYHSHQHQLPYFYRLDSFYEVVDKIGKLGYEIISFPSSCIIRNEDSSVTFYSRKPIPAYHAVAEFCKWYNEQQGWK